jgi:hypothetical protein
LKEKAALRASICFGKNIHGLRLTDLDRYEVVLKLLVPDYNTNYLGIHPGKDDACLS